LSLNVNDPIPARTTTAPTSAHHRARLGCPALVSVRRCGSLGGVVRIAGASDFIVVASCAAPNASCCSTWASASANACADGRRRLGSSTSALAQRSSSALGTAGLIADGAGTRRVRSARMLSTS
jgi:hypothetical protein